MRILLLLSVFALFGCTSAEPVSPLTPAVKVEPVQREGCAPGDGRVRNVVRSGHSAPDVKSLEKICAGVDRALREIAADRSGWGLERLRAIELLAAYPSAETSRVLAGLAVATDDLASVRRTALTVLGTTPAIVSSDVVDQIAQLAGRETDPELKAMAAETARKLKTR